MHILHHLLTHLSRGSWYKLYRHVLLFWFLYIYHHRLVKHSTLQNLIYFNSSILAQLSPYSPLNVLTYPLILGIIKFNSLIALYESSNKMVRIGFVSTNCEITVSSASTSQIFIRMFAAKNFSFTISLSPNYSIIILWEKFCDYFLANW